MYQHRDAPRAHTQPRIKTSAWTHTDTRTHTGALRTHTRLHRGRSHSRVRTRVRRVPTRVHAAPPARPRSGSPPFQHFPCPSLCPAAQDTTGCGHGARERRLCHLPGYNTPPAHSGFRLSDHRHPTGPGPALPPGLSLGPSGLLGAHGGKKDPVCVGRGHCLGLPGLCPSCTGRQGHPLGLGNRKPCFPGEDGRWRSCVSLASRRLGRQHEPHAGASGPRAPATAATGATAEQGWGAPLHVAGTPTFGGQACSPGDRRNPPEMFPPKMHLLDCNRSKHLHGTSCGQPSEVGTTTLIFRRGN